MLGILKTVNKTNVIIGKLKKPWQLPPLSPFADNFDELIIKYYNSPFVEGKGMFFPSEKEINKVKMVEFYEGYYYGIFFFPGTENIEEKANVLLAKKGFDIGNEQKG